MEDNTARSEQLLKEKRELEIQEKEVIAEISKLQQQAEALKKEAEDAKRVLASSIEQLEKVEQEKKNFLDQVGFRSSFAYKTASED